MRISDLHIVDVTMLFASESGGVRRYLTEKRNWLQRQPGVRHSFLLPRLGGSPAPEQSIALDSVRIPFSNGYRMPLSMADAARRLGALAPDVIEVGDPYTLAWSALKVAREDGVPAVAFCHTDLPAVSSMWFGRAGGRIAEIYFKRLYRHFDLVLAPSRAVTSQLLDLGVKRVAHQPLGVDPAISALGGAPPISDDSWVCRDEPVCSHIAAGSTGRKTSGC